MNTHNSNTIIGDLTFTVLRGALDALALRHRVIANNIANVDTPGFKAREVIFETVLKDALSRASGAGGGHVLPEVRPKIVTLAGDSYLINGNGVDIDLEMAKLAENTVRYSALSRALSEKLGLIKYVINGGR